MAAQRAFGQKHFKLVTGEKRLLVNPEETLEEAEIKDGECLTALVLKPQLAATEHAYALWCHGDSTIVTWGDADCGGDSSAVQDQLRGVQQMQAAGYAFHLRFWQMDQLSPGVMQIVAVTVLLFKISSGVCSRFRPHNSHLLRFWQMDQSVTWGDAARGGDSSAVQDQLRGVQQIQATLRAFAAILADGSVVAWGGADCGGDSSAVQDQLRGVQQIQATCLAFAAILADGSVVTWGDADCGGDSSAVRDQLTGVQQIQATLRAFAAILADGSVVAWGHVDMNLD
eukprot:symbB.v1.2.020488.t1/scaffold1730.1/size104407/1